MSLSEAPPAIYNPRVPDISHAVEAGKVPTFGERVIDSLTGVIFFPFTAKVVRDGSHWQVMPDQGNKDENTFMYLVRITKQIFIGGTRGVLGRRDPFRHIESYDEAESLAKWVERESRD